MAVPRLPEGYDRVPHGKCSPHCLIVLAQKASCVGSIGLPHFAINALKEQQPRSVLRVEPFVLNGGVQPFVDDLIQSLHMAVVRCQSLLSLFNDLLNGPCSVP